MAQQCGFFNAQLVGEEYDRVYLAEQFAAYFASFIGNGVFAKSMQELEVVAKETATMHIDVLSGQGWINGYWYRNTSTYDLELSIADGVLNRIDLIVLRWSSSERDMYLTVIEGTPSVSPVAPALKRDADYYDLELAQVAVNAGVVGIKQADITDMRANNSVCGFVHGLIEQLDTTDLWNQFQDYFQRFKETHENDFDQWSAFQKTTYLEYIQTMQTAYETFVSDSTADYRKWVQDQELSMENYIKATQSAYDQFVATMSSKYSDWTAAKEAEYEKWYSDHTVQWSHDFNTWFETIKEQLSDDVAGKLQNEIDEVDDKVDGYIERETVFSDDGKEITQTSGKQKIVTTFVDDFHILQEFYDNNIKIKTKAITFSQDGKVISETKEVV